MTTVGDSSTIIKETAPDAKVGISDASHSSTTLFVRNIPFETDKDALQAFFADFGPLQACFLVAKKEETSSHAGYGFVQFAIKEDACTAVKELSKKHGVKKLHGRKLKIEFALRKHLKDAQGGEAVRKGRPVKKQKMEISAASFAVHVLIQGGILSEKELMTRLRKAAGKPASIDQLTPNSYKVCYSKEAEAVRVVKKLHSKSFQVGENNSSCILLCAIITPSLKQHRIILRNLPFNATLDTLQPFHAFGHIVDMELPRKPETDTFRGFAFVQYSTREEAEQAITKGNGMKIERRPVAVDWALSKKEFGKESV